MCWVRESPTVLDNGATMRYDEDDSADPLTGFLYGAVAVLMLCVLLPCALIEEWFRPELRNRPSR